jgi:hypothetical protein
MARQKSGRDGSGNPPIKKRIRAALEDLSSWIAAADDGTYECGVHVSDLRTIRLTLEMALLEINNAEKSK